MSSVVGGSAGTVGGVSSSGTWPLSRRPAGSAWPTDDWTTGSPAADVDGERLDRAVSTLLDQRTQHGETYAVLAVHRGVIVAEQYGPQHDRSSEFLSWSIAKSITHALVGMLVGEGRLDLAAPAPIPEWAGDNRRSITLQHLLNMRDGLDFNEEYVDIGVSHVVDMLYFAGADDHAAYAIARPLAHPPGSVWNYSSGTTNIVSRIVGEVAAQGEGREAATRALLDRLFGALGMSSARPQFDKAGTFVGSSSVHATARDFARFGYLYLRDGTWQGERLLPAGWVDHARTHTADDPDNGFGYGAHWWLWPDQPGSLAAHGFEGQYVVVVPARDLVLVRLGKSPSELRPAVVEQLREIVNAFPIEFEVRQ